MTDLLIVGGGCAGLTAAIYGIRAGLSVTVLEGGFAGGQIAITNEIENYPGYVKISGPDLAMKIYDQAQALGADIRLEEAVAASLSPSVKSIRTAEGDYEGKSVIIANGVKRRMLGCPGEEKLTGKGVSYCATCDGAFFRGKTVAVIGGGDVAVEDAIFLARACEKVYLIHRRDSLRAAQSLQNTMLALPNVEVCWDSVVESINGDGQVSSLTVLHKPSGERRELPLQGVFIAVGIKPNSESFISNIASDEKGYLIAGEDCATSMPGVFAAGDIRTKKLRQIVTAVADGANAVEGVQEYFLQ